MSFEMRYDRYRKTFCASCCTNTLTIYENKLFVGDYDEHNNLKFVLLFKFSK